MHIIQQRGRLHHLNGVATVLCLWVAVNLLVASCNACGGGSSRSPSPTTRRPPTRGSTWATSRISTDSSSNISMTESPSDISPSENIACFLTTIMNLTNETIGTKLEQLSNTGRLSNLFANNTTEQSLFLKYLKPNDTDCLNVQGFMIKISKITPCSSNCFNYSIAQLNETSARNLCNRSCMPLTFPTVFKPTTATSKITEKPGPIDATSKQTTGSRPTGHATSKETNAGEGEGTAVAGKAGGGGVSTATIVIPVTLAVLLVIVVAIFALWFKRRSARKNNKELTETKNSVDRLAGPVNGDVYTVVNPSAEKKNKKNDGNDLVYTELAEMNPGKRDYKQPKPDQTQYADITHVLTDDTTTFKTGTPQTDENETYANVVAVKK